MTDREFFRRQKQLETDIIKLQNYAEILQKFISLAAIILLICVFFWLLD
nr:MAG TPA: protein of unknown function (DUF4519) [Bacteriophage sp.]